MTDEAAGQDPQAYNDWLTRVEAGQGLSLAEYHHWRQFDPNLPWRLSPGHLVNLLDDAADVERVRAVGRLLVDEGHMTPYGAHLLNRVLEAR